MAIVTGATRGIGRAIALELARRGADVTFNYARSGEAAESLTREIEALGVRALAAQCDVAYNRLRVDDGFALVILVGDFDQPLVLLGQHLLLLVTLVFGNVPEPVLDRASASLLPRVPMRRVRVVDVDIMRETLNVKRKP